MKAPPCPGPHKALSAAISQAMDEPLTDWLAEADFGCYAAADAGWWFRLRFTREIREDGRASEPDGGARRVEAIIDAWEKSPAVRDWFAQEGMRSMGAEAR